MAPAKKNTKNKNRGVPIAGIVLAGLLIAAGIAWFMFFRDTSPQSVDSVAAQEAREQAIQEASAGAAGETDTDAGSAGDPQAAPEADAQTAETDTTQPESGGETELDSGQPDSAASVGAPSDGVWVVDSSIGTFDDACLTEVCGSGFAGFRINEELAGIGAKTVVGRTPDVSGSMEVLGTQVIGATFTVDMTTLVTDNPSRTDALKGTSGGLETSTFPTAVFELTEPIELGQVPIEGVAIDVQATGNLTVHGVTRPVTIPLTAEMQAGLISVFGNLEGMLLSDYDIPTPSAVVVVSVEDNATMELQLFLSR